ncbi:MAG TPA: ethylbenzene dehydrogenase-related protein, partial [Dehalococcoidia bacterium]|nr:ethylbenzene dehydrogenase-related protein [Dehalococcoidia bacterium]
NTKYGTAATKLNSCGTCHQDPEGGGPFNPYGTAFQGAAGTTDQKFTAIEGLDSDGDTYLNLAEIQAGTWPGDPADFPGSTATPTPSPTPVPPIILNSASVVTAPVVDGVAEDLWNAATAVTIPVANGANMGSTDVSVKSVYTNDHVYFLLDYADPTESLRRMPWQKQADGSWLKLSTSTTHQENTYYEDKVSLLWDIDVTGFANQGCATVCHAGEQPANSGYGSMYTPNEGEEADMWHWKAVRTNPNGQVDDQYLNGNHYDAVTAPEAGRHSDPRTGGGYSDNVTLNAQGDVDCSGGAVSAVDALKILRNVASLPVTQTEPCADIGTMAPPLQGDVDCNGLVTAVDALKVLRKVAGLSVVQTEPCFDIGVKGPRFTSTEQPADPYWILDGDKLPFADTYNTNDEIAAIITAAITGDRGDIQGKAVYTGGHWVLEVGRPLTTASTHDVQFNNLGVDYSFGLAVFDNAAVNHAYQSGVSKLHFVPAP